MGMQQDSRTHLFFTGHYMYLPLHHSWSDLVYCALMGLPLACGQVLCTALVPHKSGTPLIQLSIEKHAKTMLCDCNFIPHVTMFGKFCSQKSLNWRWNFILSFISWCRSSLLFKIQAREQRHRFSALACRPLHQKQLGPEFMCLQSTHIGIQTFLDYLNNDQVILLQIHNK